MGFLLVFGSFLGSLWGPVAPMFQHFCGVLFSHSAPRRPEQLLADFQSIFGVILKPFLHVFGQGWKV